MPARIKKYPEIKYKAAKKPTKIETPAVKAAKKEVDKAQKRLSTAKTKLKIAIKKKEKK